MAKKIPKYSYTGSSRAYMKDSYWVIELKSSGRLTMNCGKSVDVCCVGGGGGGSCGDGAGQGGGGGRVVTGAVTLTAGTGYNVIVGAGGAASGGTGGTTSAIGVSAPGGTGASWDTGGSGGCGGSTAPARNGSRDGADGNGGYPERWPGTGQHYTTRAFGDASFSLYAGGGAGGHWAGSGGIGYDGGGSGGRKKSAHEDGYPGAVNTGGGGGGSGGQGWGGAGGSGIVLIRGTQDDEIPVTFNSAKLEKILFNGTKIEHLIYNGRTIYVRSIMEKIKGWFLKKGKAVEPA